MLAQQVSVSSAQEGNSAAIIVRFDDETIVSRCVDFSEEEITGYEGLRLAGFSIDAGFAAQGGKVCRINETGCPADDCFCQCQGGPDCVYWSYWHMDEEAWSYSMVGATSYRIKDGSIDGWSWGPGNVNQAIEPPLISYDEICGDQANGVSTQEAASTSQVDEDSTPWLRYLPLGLLLGGIGLLVVFGAVRKARS